MFAHIEGSERDYLQSENDQVLQSHQTAIAALQAELQQVRSAHALLDSARLQLLGPWGMKTFHRKSARQAPNKQTAFGTVALFRDDEASLCPTLDLPALLGVPPGAHAVEMESLSRVFPLPFARPALHEIQRSDVFLVVAVKERIHQKQEQQQQQQQPPPRSVSVDPRNFTVEDWEAIRVRVLTLDRRKSDSPAFPGAKARAGPSPADLRLRYFWLAEQSRKLERHQSDDRTKNTLTGDGGRDWQDAEVASIEQLLEKQFGHFYGSEAAASEAADDDDDDDEDDIPLVRRFAGLQNQNRQKQSLTKQDNDDDSNESSSSSSSSSCSSDNDHKEDAIVNESEGLNLNSVVTFVASRHLGEQPGPRSLCQLLRVAMQKRDESLQQKRKVVEENADGAAAVPPPLLLSAWDRANVIIAAVKIRCEGAPWSANDMGLLRSIILDQASCPIGSSSRSPFSAIDRFRASAENPFRSVKEISNMSKRIGSTIHYRRRQDEEQHGHKNNNTVVPSRDLSNDADITTDYDRREALKIRLLSAKFPEQQQLQQAQEKKPPTNNLRSSTVKEIAALIASGKFSRSVNKVPQPTGAGKKGTTAEVKFSAAAVEWVFGSFL